jgi:integrase/recombinase XerC
MIDSFLKYLQFERRVSPNTLLAYNSDLVQFRDFIKKTFHLDDLAAADYGLVRSWIISLVETKIDAASVNRKIACLRTYYKFLLREEIIRKDPMARIRFLKTKKKLPGFVKENDMATLLDNKEAFSGDFAGSRERLVLELFYGTGVRLAELLALKEKQIDFENRTIKVLGKRNKERVIPFSSHLVSILKEYAGMKKKHVQSDNGVLLVTDSGEPCYPMMIYRIVKKHLSLHTTSDKKSPHILRHTYATHLLDKGAEINAVKELLGHSSLAATQVYTHNSMEKLKRIFDQAHPKA